MMFLVAANQNRIAVGGTSFNSIDEMEQETINPNELINNPVESPHFRPAFSDLTNDVLPLESPGQIAKKRKSLGRRVSFAAKAKVRFIENEEREVVENDENEDDIFLLSKPEPTPDFVLGGGNSPARVVSIPAVHEVNSPSGMSIVSNESIEIELRDPHSSFNSYDSEIDGIEDGKIADNDNMEITNCVGGIISTTTTLPSTNSMAEDNTMDFTTCIGGILGQLPKSTNEFNMRSPSSIDTMELTSVVGGILKGRQRLVSSDDPNSPMTFIPATKQLLSQPDANDGGDMEMTLIVKDTIKRAAAIPPSPSPFLVHSPMKRMMNSPLQSEVSFVGDVDANSLVNGVSPIISRTSTRDGEEKDMDLTTELFNRYIDTNRLKAMISGPSEPPMTRPTAVVVEPSTPNTVPPSQTESPTVTILLPRASLKDFLIETGVRFLDNLSSLNRRETSGRPRESEVVSHDRQMFVDGGLSIESDALDEACGQLVSMISQLKDELSRQEDQFNHSPPLPFLEYRDPNERSTVISKLKTLKSIARLYAKQAWYEWRGMIHDGLNRKLAQNVEIAERRALYLKNLDEKLDELVSTLEPVVVSITNEVTITRDKINYVQGDDIEHAQQLENLAAFQQTKIVSVDEEMTILLAREQELRQSIEAALAKRQELQQSLGSLKQQIESVPESTPIVLDELRSSLKLLQGTIGWKLIRLSPSEISLNFVRVGLGVTFNLSHGIEAGPGAEKTKVASVIFDVSSVKSRLLRHIPRILKVPSHDMSLANCMLFVGQKLDRICQIDKQLSIVGVQCQVEVPENIEMERDVIPIAIRFFNQHHGIKFDLLLTIDSDRIAYSQFVHFYGRIQEHHIIDVVNLSLQNKFNQIRRVVAVVIDLIENIQ